MKRKQRYLDFSWRWLLLLALAFAWLPSTAVPVLAADNITLTVVSAQNGAPITDYKYIINVDNTGTTAQRSPEPGTGCSPDSPGYPEVASGPRSPACLAPARSTRRETRVTLAM